MQIKVIKKETETKKLRVCAYCRVSTDADEQENSLENQIRHYEDVIRSNPDYEYAGVYSDFGISGFKERRPGFQRMLADARVGKIDLILTKSVSRFARNTSIVLKTSRELKALNVGIFFELQNINTLSGEGELMLSILAGFAQAESESGSIGAKMVYRRKYEAGIPVQYLDRSFGYRRDEYGRFRPDEDEAPWVIKIYEMAADGCTLAAISNFMNENGIPTVQGARWTESTVQRILENEIYKGDFLMHKHYVNEERKLVRNRGEVDAWYIEDDHEPIVSPKLWERAKEARAERRKYIDTHSFVGDLTEENYPYMGKIFCAECGYPLYRRVYSYGNRASWDCSGVKRYGKKFCGGVTVLDGIVRKNWTSGNVYISAKKNDKGIKEYSFLKEASWKRRHKKREAELGTPANTEENYPYRKKIYCGICGCRLVRYRATRTGKISWICNGNKRKGKEFCKGVRVPDSVIRSWGNIDRDIYITGKDEGNGTKRYSYSCKKPAD